MQWCWRSLLWPRAEVQQTLLPQSWMCVFPNSHNFGGSTMYLLMRHALLKAIEKYKWDFCMWQAGRQLWKQEVLKSQKSLSHMRAFFKHHTTWFSKLILQNGAIFLEEKSMNHLTSQFIWTYSQTANYVERQLVKKWKPDLDYAVSRGTNLYLSTLWFLHAFLWNISCCLMY